MPWRIARTAFWIAWQIALICDCAILVLMEPIVSAILIPVAHLSFLITLIFGFLIHDRHFPRWRMLAFSVGALLMYWLFFPGGHPNSPTYGHLKFLHPERGVTRS